MTISGVILTLMAALSASCASKDAAPTDGASVRDTVSTTVAATLTGAQPSAVETRPAAGAAARRELRFRGNGDRRLPAFAVARGGSTLFWTNRGEVFSLFGEARTLVDSVDDRGQTFLPRGVYRIDVVASGDWVIRIPRARRVR